MSAFAHVLERTGQIMAITQNADPREGHLLVEIDEELSLNFARGHENPHHWQPVLTDGKYHLVKKAAVPRAERIRTELLPVIELKIRPAQKIDTALVPGAQAVIVVDRAGQLEVFYDGEFIKTTNKPLKIYVTREGDPSYLKHVISLDVNILDAYMEQLNLTEWPNPLCISLANGTDDISLFVHSTSKILAFEKADNAESSDS